MKNFTLRLGMLCLLFMGTGLYLSTTEIKAESTESTAAVTSGCYNNLLTNPSYECGNLSGWTKWGCNAWATCYSGCINEGGYAAKIGNQGGLAQTIYNLTPGDVYDVSVFAKHTGCNWAGVGLKIWDAGYNNVLDETSTTIGSSYKKYTNSITIPAGAAHMEVYVWKNGNDGYVCMDDWCLTKSTPSNPPLVCDGNEMDNPSFENNFNNWERWGSSASSIQSTWVNSGSKAAKLGCRGGIAQRFLNLTPGDVYTLTGYGKIHGNNCSSSFGLKVWDANYNNVLSQEYVTIQKNTGYNEYTVTMTIPSGAYALEAFAWRNDNNTSQSLYIDDLCVTKSSTPPQPPLTCDGNLLQNGDLESGNLTGWDDWGSSVFVTGNTSNVNSGSHAHELPANAGVAQSFYNFKAGAVLTLNVWAKATSNLNYGDIVMYATDIDGNVIDIQYVVPLATTYTEYTVSLTVPQNTYRVEVYAWRDGSAGTLWVDDWCLTIEDEGIVIPEPINCVPDALSWSNNIYINTSGNTAADVRFIRNGTTTYDITSDLNLPADFNGAVDITIDQAVAYDGYTNREQTGEQADERFKVVFLKNNVVVHSSPYTGTATDDGLETGLLTDEWAGSLGSASLPNGADQVLLVHYNDNTYGEGSGNSSPNSVYPSSVCISFNPATNPGVIDIEQTITPDLINSNQEDVFFVYAVTNPGTVPLGNITLSGDTPCPTSEAIFAGGDTNNNSLLESTETWTYYVQCNFTWSSPEVRTNTVIVTGLTEQGDEVKANDTDPYELAGNNMQVMLSSNYAEPGDVIQVKLVIRNLAPRNNMKYQFSDVEFGSNMYQNGATQTASPSHPLWADPTSDVVNTLSGSESLALDGNDGADAGMYADWIFEYDYTVPSDASGSIYFSAWDGGTIRALFDDGVWREVSNSMSYGGDVLYVSNNNSMVTYNHGDQTLDGINGMEITETTPQFAPRGEMRVTEIVSSELTVFPNPATEFVKVEGLEAFTGNDYFIYNNLGQVVASGQVTSATMKVDVTDYLEGVYFIDVKTDDVQSRATFIKQ